MFLGLPDPLITSKDPAPDTSIIKAGKKTLIATVKCFVTSLWLLIFEEWWKCTRAPDPDPHPDPYDPYVWASRISIRIRESEGTDYGSEDPAPDPDPYQNVTDPQYCFKTAIVFSPFLDAIRGKNAPSSFHAVILQILQVFIFWCRQAEYKFCKALLGYELLDFFKRLHEKRFNSMLRIRDPVPFWPLDPDPESRIGFFRIPDLGSQTHIFKRLVKIFG